MILSSIKFFRIRLDSVKKRSSYCEHMANVVIVAKQVDIEIWLEERLC